MQDLPNITVAEIAVVAAAVLCFSASPAVLSWIDRRRRERQARLALAAAAADSAIGSAPIGAVEDTQDRDAGVGGESASGSGMAVGSVDVSPFTAGPIALLDAAGDAPVTLPAAAIAAVEGEESAAPEARPADVPSIAPSLAPSLEFHESGEGELPRPVAAEAGVIEAKATPLGAPAPEAAVSAATVTPPAGAFRVQLHELRRVRFLDWPPADVLADPNRAAVWQEATQLAWVHEAAIGAVELSVTVPIQSTCLGAAEGLETGVRLRFLLFEASWPNSPAEAVAEAIFDIDRQAGVVSSSVLPRGTH